MTVEEIIEDRKSYKPPTVEQALEWFPDASPTSPLPPPDMKDKKQVDWLIKQEKKTLEEIFEAEGIVNNITRPSITEEQTIKWLLGTVYVTAPREKAERKLKKLQMTRMMLNPKKRGMVGKSGVSMAEVERAKQFPIDQLVDFRHSVALCLWHSERTPSMHYYKNDNHVHCYGGCGSKDAIDVHRVLHNTDFITSVKALQ